MSKSVMRDLIAIRDEIARRRIFLAKEDDIYSKMMEIEKKIDTIGERFADTAPGPEIDRSTETPVKFKRKKKIIELISQSQSRRLTAYELSILLHISRTRCNEYLKELERDNVVKGELEEKKMYYQLIDKRFIGM